MSTTPPSTEHEAEAASGTDHPDPAATDGSVSRDSSRSPRLTTGTGRSDRWADSTRDESTRVSRTAPLAFDPSCTRRLRNCVDGENAAFPDAR